MLDILSRQRDIILPPPNVLHERSSIGKSTILVNDENVEIHRFPNEIDHRLVAVDPITFRDRRPAGDRYRYDTITNGGIDRGTSVYKPAPDIDRGFPFSVLLDTAWFTGLEGHNDRIAEIIMKELGVSVVLIGPEFSAFEPTVIGAETDLRGIASLSTGISLAQSAEASASIYTTLKKDEPYLGLKDKVLDGGESRGAMIAQIRRAYLECFGSMSIASDLTDPNMHERAFQKFADTIRLIKWPVREVLGAAAVGVSHAANGELKYMNGTIPLDMRYVIGATVGTGPALFSGEESLGASYTSYDHPQHILNFKGSGAAHTEARKKSYVDHYNTTFKELRGCHLSLGYSSVLSYFIARSLELGEGFPDVGQVNPDWIKKIHAAKPSRYMKKQVKLENAAA